MQVIAMNATIDFKLYESNLARKSYCTKNHRSNYEFDILIRYYIGITV